MSTQRRRHPAPFTFSLFLNAPSPADGLRSVYRVLSGIYRGAPFKPSVGLSGVVLKFSPTLRFFVPHPSLRCEGGVFRSCSRWPGWPVGPMTRLFVLDGPMARSPDGPILPLFSY